MPKPNPTNPARQEKMSSTADTLSLKGDKSSLHTLHRSIVTIYVGPEKHPFYFHKGRLCQHSAFFEKAFHGSFEEATTGSMYLEEDGVDELKVFEEWLYSQNLSYPKDSDEPSLLLVKVFCFAEKVGIPDLQNAMLDAIRDRATEQHASLVTSDTTQNTYVIPQNTFGYTQVPTFQYQTLLATSPTLEKPLASYLSPATSSAIHYTYQNTPEGSPLRKLLADIFAYNVKPETLDEEILSFPAEFMADVLLINMKRLPLRLENEKADFDVSTNKYHVRDSPSTRCDRKQRVFKDMEVREITRVFDTRDESPAEADVPECALTVEAAVPEPEPEPEPASEVAVEEGNLWRSGFGKSSSSKGKKKRY